MSSEKAQRINAFLEQVKDRISPDHYEDVRDYLRETEWQLAIELLGEFLDERDSKLSRAEWATFSELARSVEVDPAGFSHLTARSN